MSGKDNLHLWEEHIRGEFVTKDVHLALSTMTEDASVWTIPTKWGAKGKVALLPLYRDEFIPSIPEEWESIIVNRVVTDDCIVEEMRSRFRHTKRMDWFLPGEEPTGKIIEIDGITVIEFRGGLMSAERLYWDEASALRQIGKLPSR
jgi:carboxymethylenebutenolidase